MVYAITPQHLRRMLPPAMVEMHDLLGNAGLLTLIEAYGGTRLSIPGQITATSPLANLVGIVAAKFLAERWGPGSLQIALCKTWRIHLLRTQGLSYDIIARRVGVAQKTVYREIQRDRTHGGSFSVGLTERSQMGFKFD